MIVTCPECSARYRLADDAVPAEGRAMRCATCSHRWYQAAPDALPVTPVAASPAPTPEQLAWTPAPDDADDAPRRVSTLGKVVAVLVLGVGVAAGAAALWGPRLAIPGVTLPKVELASIDLSGIPWLDRIVSPPPPVSPLAIAFSVDRQALADGRPLFVIAGSIANPTDAAHAVPPIEGRLVDAARNITYHWRIAAPVATLAPRQRTAFTASAVGQPYGGEQVTLHFAG